MTQARGDTVRDLEVMAEMGGVNRLGRVLEATVDQISDGLDKEGVES